MNDIFKKGLSLLLKRQTNILSAAFVIMATVIFSQVLGLVRQRLLVAIFGASNTLGIYLASSRLPDSLFQIIIAGALSSAFIPVFSNYLVKNREKEGQIFASTLLSLSLVVFFIVGVVLFVFANFFSYVIAPGFTEHEIMLMANLMRIIILGELLFIIGSFLSAILQSYNHFFIPGIAAATYNLGIIIGILLLSGSTGIFSAAWGVVIGAFIFVLIQLPFLKKIGFYFHPADFFHTEGIKEVFHLMWPRTISIAIFQIGILITVTLVSFLEDPGRNYVIFDYAQTLAFAPVVLFGQTIAQAAFPVLSRQRENLVLFKETFLTSFYEMMYLILPISVLFLVLRIPIVRLIYGASLFDWPATVETGRTLGIFSISLFAQALIYLVSRAYYALHDTKTPLIVGTISTVMMLILSALSIVIYRSGLHQGVIPYGFFNGFWRGEFIVDFGTGGIAAAYTITSIFQFVILFVILGKKTNGFNISALFSPLLKIFVATLFTAFTLYVPIKLLDRLVFDTTKTINLLILTGISSFAGLSLYIFLTWLFNVKEAKTFLLMFKKLGNWREILGKTEETIDPAHFKPS